ncbi:hypothetical protein [Beijerinckia indica]|uniref:SMP-30/Gluconolactonase/LRE-like region domain-containing protein n=1 Tax=Beijerinckia indica subsp. indica (strain ATCC 9039 / DSM 1715 / NCIMB 8712) TaxID=395963 RepID=B2IF55_BEII9|nr:hypothetical protein [Beijerinckia indica]ACB95620.1 conserved hypothetical protein [Beijerinckia indica subsp. indica ATCC 9039]
MHWLDDGNFSPAELASHVEQVRGNTPTTGGIAIDDAGTIYLSGTDNRRILAIGADGKVSTLIANPRLIWSDAMWVDNDGFLWIPASQQNPTPGFTGGKREVNYPVGILQNADPSEAGLE